MVRFQDHRQHVEELYAAALAAVEPRAVVQAHLRRAGDTLHVADFSHDLGQGQVIVISVGKAAQPMAAAAVETLAGKPFTAVVISKQHAVQAGADILAGDPAVHLLHGSHPVSDEDSVSATAVATAAARDAGPDDLVLCLISGGTSALLTQPRIPLADWQALTNVLLASGCTINDLNTVRRQLDEVKGGGLARLAAPARCISLILSDVVGNPLEAIGSGPTILTHEAPQEALDVLARFGVAEHLPAATYGRVIAALAAQDERPVAPAAASDVRIVGDVRRAALAALARAMQLGFVSQLLTTHLQGEAREVGRVAAAIATDTPPGRCFVLGGETTVTLQGDGRGGRNLELALAAALALEGQESRVVASLATDGEDGPTPAAGAVVSGGTAVLARRHSLSPEQYLADNDSYTFFERLDTAVAAALPTVPFVAPAMVNVGSTGTNVNDLLIILTYPAQVLPSGSAATNEINTVLEDTA